MSLITKARKIKSVAKSFIKPQYTVHRAIIQKNIRKARKAGMPSASTVEAANSRAGKATRKVDSLAATLKKEVPGSPRHRMVGKKLDKYKNKAKEYLNSSKSRSEHIDNINRKSSREVAHRAGAQMAVLGGAYSSGVYAASRANRAKKSKKA